MPRKRLSEEVRKAHARERKARWRQHVATPQNQPQPSSQQQTVHSIAALISEAGPARSPSPEPASHEPIEDDYQPVDGFDRSRDPSPGQDATPPQDANLSDEVESSEGDEEWLDDEYISGHEDIFTEKWV